MRRREVYTEREGTESLRVWDPTYCETIFCSREEEFNEKT